MPYVIALMMVAVSIFMAPTAQAEKRVALVIGNSAYEQTTRLKNPYNDAADVAAAFKKLGFEVVEGHDLDKRAMERVIRQFGVGLAGADLALVFYAGHGLQVNGQNYLIPTDARLVSEGDIDFEGIPLALVLRQMEREAKTSVVLLDACRDNPLARNLARTMGTRSSQIGQGLAEVKTGVGTLIGFSTQPGNVALDGQGRNSPYAEALLKHIDVPGKDVSVVLNMVRGDVLKSTNGKQVPWEHTSLVGSVYFKAQGSIVTEPVEQAPKTDSAELAFWGSVKESKSTAMLKTYLEHFPSGMFASLAQLMIEQLNKEEAARLALTQREEELKRAEQAKQVAEVKRSDELRKTEEAKRAEDLRVAQEEMRKAQAALKTAQSDREAALKAAEEARKDAATKLASLPSNTSTPKQIDAPTRDPAALASSLQKELKRVGCDPGSLDGTWGPKAKQALADFASVTKLSVPLDQPSDAALEVVSQQKGKICTLSCKAGETEVNGKCAPSAKPEATKSAAKNRDGGSQRASKESEGSSGGGMCWLNSGPARLVPCGSGDNGRKVFKD